MTISLASDGGWRATFTGTTEGIWMAKITARQLGGPSPTYDAVAIPTEQFPNITVSNSIPQNRLIGPIEYNPANIDDPCIIFVHENQSPQLWIMSEVIGTVDCPAASSFNSPISNPQARLNDLNFVHTPSSAGAIGQAI
jgi:hypothetical protein